MSDTLVITAAPPPPSFAKAFSPQVITSGETSTLTFTIDNSASPLPATGLNFTDNLPTGMVVAPTPNAGTTCSGGTLTAIAGSPVVSYIGGSVPGSSTCTVSVDVEGTVVGNLVNTTEELSSNLGNSGTAQASLLVGSATPVPALGGWGVLAMAGLLGASMLFVARRRRGA